MYNLPAEMINKIYADDAKILIEMNVTLANGAEIVLDNSKIWKRSLSVDSSTSEAGNFTLGTCAAKKLMFSLNNIQGEFNLYDFIDATIRLKVGMMLSTGKTIVDYGIFTITGGTYDEHSIDIIALDNISKLSHVYASRFNFPMNLRDLVISCCDACGVSLNVASLPQYAGSFRVMSLPSNNSLTYASLVVYAAQICACYVKCQPNGTIAFGRYEFGNIPETYFGGTFDTKTTPYSDGANLWGGTFAFNDGDNVHGGTFDWTGYHVINTQISATIDTDDARITGVLVTSVPNDDNNADADSVLAGTEGYVISITDNPLIQRGQASSVASYLLSVLNGMDFRPFNGSIPTNPAIEAGDVGIIADSKGNYHRVFFSNVVWRPVGAMSIACDAQNKNRQNVNNSNAMTEVLQKAKQFVEGERTSRENQMIALQEEIANASGFYESSESDGQGGMIFYQHNRPSRAQSDIIWKETATTRSVSTDGGKTWNFAINADGNAIANRLAVVGLDAGWINAGTLKIGGKSTGNTDGAITVYDANDNLIFSCNKEGVKIVAAGSGGKETIIEGGTIRSNSAYFEGGKIRIASAEDTDDLIQLTTVANNAWKYTSVYNGGVTCSNGTGQTYNANIEGRTALSSVGLFVYKKGGAYNDYQHRLRYNGMGFFGKFVYESSRPSISTLSESASTADIVKTLNKVITALKDYGLVR